MDDVRRKLRREGMHEYRIRGIVRTLFWPGAQLKRIKLKEKSGKTGECSFITKVFCATNVIPPLNAITGCIRLYNSLSCAHSQIPTTSRRNYFPSFYFSRPFFLRIAIIKEIILLKDRPRDCHFEDSHRTPLSNERG